MQHLCDTYLTLFILFLYQLKVDLGAVEVDAGDLDGDFVTEDEVFGMLDGGHMDESFAAGVFQLDKEAEIGDAGDEAGEDLAEMVLHPHGLVHLDRVAFGLGSLLLTRRAVLAFLLEFLAGQCFFFPGEDILLHEAVDHEVGIAANGRGEMGVMAESQAVMADVISRVNGFGLGPDREHIYRALDGFLRDLMMSHFGGHGALAFELLDILEFFGIGEVMDAIDEGSSGTDGFGYGAVGKEHEFLDEMMGFVRGFEVDLDGMAMFIEAKAHLILLDRESAIGDALGTEFGGERIEDFEGFRNLGIPEYRYIDALKNGLGLVVIEAGIGADDGAADLIFEYVRIGVHGEDDGHAEFVFIGAEGTFVVAQFLGEHGEDAVDEIDGGAALVGLVVDLGAGADVERHVGDVNANLILKIGD